MLRMQEVLNYRMMSSFVTQSKAEIYHKAEGKKKTTHIAFGPVTKRQYGLCAA